MPGEIIVTHDKSQRRRRYRRFAMFAGLPLLAAGLFFVPRALAFGGFHRGPFGHHGPESADDVRDHMQDRADFVLDKLKASDAQRAQVQTILDKAAPQMFQLHADGRKVKDEIKSALLADTLDQARLDKARADLDALADRATDLGMDTMVAVSNVLTPAQRKQVAEHLSRFHH